MDATHRSRCVRSPGARYLPTSIRRTTGPLALAGTRAGTRAAALVGVLVGVLAGVLGWGAPAGATNGTRAIAYGAASAQLAGSDIASASDPSVVNTNPANLSRIASRRFDFGALAVVSRDEHSDALGNDARVDNAVTPIAGIGYGHRLAQSGVVVGGGFFVQGGAGSVYEDLRTPLGTRDEYSSLYAVFLATLGASWEIDERLAIGLSVSAVGAIANQKLLPDTSFHSPFFSYYGLEVEDARATRPGVRAGIRYQASPELALGAQVSTKVDLPMSGSAIADLGSIGLGKVRYRSLDVEGLGVPAEVAVGATWRVAPSVEVSGKLERIFWSDVYRSIRYVATDPENPGAPPRIELQTRLDWKDQTVAAAGVAWTVDARTTIRGGVNYGSPPGRPETTGPLLSGIDRWHLTAGFSHRLHAEYELFGGIEYLVPEKLVYTNPEQPFGQSAEIRRRYTALHVAIARRW